MKKNNLKRVGGLFLILLVLSTGCNKKENEVSTYDKEESNIVDKNNNKGEPNGAVKDHGDVEIGDIEVVGETDENTGEKFVVLKVYDNDGELFWSYTTDTVFSTNSSETEYFVGEKNIYINDSGKLVALDKETGDKIWTKTDCKVSDYSEGVELDDSLYLVAEGPDYQLLVVNIENGKTVKQLDTTVKVQEKSADKRYSEYLTNLAKDIKENYKDGSYENFQYGGNEKEFTVELNEKLELVLSYKDSSSNNKKVTIGKNVVQFYILDEGNGGLQNIYYITTNGSVYSLNAEELILNNSTKFESTKVNFKNIVSIQQGQFNAKKSGASSPLFIDIDGNIYHK